EEADAPDATSAELDPLVANGLASPLCRGAPGGSRLSRASASNCQTSGFVAASAPTNDYGIDVHIDTGAFGLSGAELLSIVQELFVTPVWTALVWAVHALVVMLEWCFTIDLLDSPSVGVGVARALRHVQAAFTAPWLATVLAVGAVLAAYNGLIRRRVAETVGQALLVLAMMAGGVWVTVDPVGTVGALGSWANQAGLSTLAVTASGTPSKGGQALADSMGTVFSAAVEVPWCYLEFGDVGWCRNPARLDPRLHAAALAIAAGELAFARCRHTSPAFGLCAAPGSAQAEALERSARLLRAARSNGAVFLALPANDAQRNSINDPESLLRAICLSEKATSCRGPASAQAEFRTDRGTWARVAGLLLILGGVLGLLLLLGFLALRLLAAALIGLLYLMLAPAAVLAPALGDGGRAVFRSWATQLLGAVVSKLLFSFLLGAVLAVLGVLQNLEALGWWTQWLLMSAFWWGAFAHRHKALQVAGGAIGQAQNHERRTLLRRASDALETPRRLLSDARAAKLRHEQRRANRTAEADLRATVAPRPARAKPAAEAGLRLADVRMRNLAEAPADRSASATAAEQARRTLQADDRDARALVETAPAIEQRLAAMRERLVRITEQHSEALAAEDTQRLARLAHRAQRIEGDAERERAGLVAARRIVADGQSARSAVVSAQRMRERGRFLDAQAALAPSGRAGKADSRRDYAALAGLAGCAPREYERLAAADRRAARLEIDRELASRTLARGGWGAGEAQARASVRRDATPEGSGGHAVSPRAPGARGAPVERVARDASPRRHGPSIAAESSVMADIREVAARRKRQLGRGRP
ncbi:MAG TPA: hypothetical protein VK605_09020, partial [Solirubrobacteraceae bacterium]|nr:hypothetical protein [Solirubrobacteraceae bacterium]